MVNHSILVTIDPYYGNLNYFLKKNPNFLGFGVPYFNTFFNGTIMKKKVYTFFSLVTENPNFRVSIDPYYGSLNYFLKKNPNFPGPGRGPGIGEYMVDKEMA